MKRENVTEYLHVLTIAQRKNATRNEKEETHDAREEFFNFTADGIDRKRKEQAAEAKTAKLRIHFHQSIDVDDSFVGITCEPMTSILLRANCKCFSVRSFS
jgi:hypothetical protein